MALFAFGKSLCKPHWNSLLANYHHGRETGDYFYGFGSIILYAIHALGVGKNLAAVERDIALYQQEVQRIQGLYINNIFPIYRQGFRALLGQTAAPTSLSGDEFDEEAVLAHLATINNNLSRRHLYVQAHPRLPDGRV